jgi:type I restriction enzyme, S subunit
MNDISIIALGNLIEFQRGFDLPKSSIIEGDFPVISSNGVLGYHFEYKVKGPGITIGRSGTVGLPHYIESNFFPHNTSLFVKDFKGNYPRYIFYLLKTLGLNDRKSGSGVPTMNRNHLHPLKVRAHLDINIQKNIAAVLYSIDSKIELNKRINSELEAMAKTLYDYLFVQFDFPDSEGKPYKTCGGKMVWNEVCKREVPVGWINGTLGNISDLVRGVTYDSKDIKNENEDGVIPILRATNITGNVIDLNEMVYVSKKNVSAAQILNKYDILITMSSGSMEHIGKNGFFYFEKKVAFGAFCAKIVAKEAFRFYLYSYTQSDFMFTTIKNECLGTNINNLNGTLIKGFKIIIPQIEIINSFNETVFPVFEKIGNNLIENQKLSELRDWLLPMLMNGQIKVK